MTINPEPVVSNQTDSICSDVASGVSFNGSSSVAAATYTITSINANGLTPSAGNPATGTNLAVNVIADDAWTNTTPLPVNVVYTVVPVSAASCAGEPFTFTLTVNPEPVVVNQTVTICSDAALGVNFNSSSSVGATSYNVTNLQLNGLVVSAGGAAIATGLTANALFNDAFTNLTSLPVLWMQSGLSPI
mgnify:CR=1 FL=1